MRDLTSGQETVRYTLPSARGNFYPSQTSVGPDGNVWLLANLVGERAAIVLPAGGGDARVVYGAKNEDALLLSAACVSGDGKGVWVTPRNAGADNASAREVVWAPADGGQPIQSGLTIAGLAGIAASADGSKLLLLRNSVVDQLWSVRMAPSKGAAAGTR